MTSWMIPPGPNVEAGGYSPGEVVVIWGLAGALIGTALAALVGRRRGYRDERLYNLAVQGAAWGVLVAEASLAVGGLAYVLLNLK